MVLSVSANPSVAFFFFFLAAALVEFSLSTAAEAAFPLSVATGGFCFLVLGASPMVATLEEEPPGAFLFPAGGVALELCPMPESRQPASGAPAEFRAGVETQQ